MNPLSVLLTTEGTYPHYRGGVTVWCDQLVRQLADVQFHVLSITHSPVQPIVCPLAPNVVSLRALPLWGTDEPGVSGAAFPSVIRRKLKTSPEIIGSSFIDPFKAAVRSLLRCRFPEELAEALVALHLFFQSHDYAISMGSEQAWDAFLRLSQECSGSGITLGDATNHMRWLMRYLAVVAIPCAAVDVVHASMAGLPGIAGVLHKRVKGSAFLLSEHGIYLRELYMNLGRSEYNLASRRFLLTINENIVRMNYHFADQVSSLCEFNKKWQVRLGAIPSRISVVPNGCDASVFYPSGKDRQSPLTVLTMARISPIKGIEVLLRAASMVRAAVPEVRFRILGEVADQAYFERCLALVESLSLSSVVEFGATSDSAAAYREADVFCLSSISEAMPYSILEAMLSGCPVVATETGGIPEMLGGTGVVVNPGDAPALAEALISLLHGVSGASRRIVLGRAALNRAKERYTVQKCSTRFRNLYSQLRDATTTRTIHQTGFERSTATSAAR